MPNLARRKELEALKRALQHIPPDQAQRRVSNKVKKRIAGTAQRDIPYIPPSLMDDTQRKRESIDETLIQMAKEKRERRARKILLDTTNLC